MGQREDEGQAVVVQVLLQARDPLQMGKETCLAEVHEVAKPQLENRVAVLEGSVTGRARLQAERLVGAADAPVAAGTVDEAGVALEI